MWDDDDLITWVSDEPPRPLRDILARFAPPYMPEITIEQGWWPLLVRLGDRLTALDDDYRVRRVIPKDGRLHFELASPLWTASLASVVKAAEDESARTCEVCGRPGRWRGPSKLYTVLCDEDAGPL